MTLRSLAVGLRALFHRDVVDQELDDELRHYLEQAIQENARAGMTPAAAERAARVRMGTLTDAREQALSGGWEAAVESVLKDLRYGVRALRRNPGFAIVAVLTLALGIGANTAMFSVVNAVIFRPLPYRDAGKLALIWTNDARRGLPREATAYSTVTDWKTGNRTFSDIAYFSTQRVAVISHSLWQRWYSGDFAILGRTLSFDDQSKMGLGTLTIVGVMPPGFYFADRQTEIFTPSTTYWRFFRESSMRHEEPARRNG